MPATILVVDDDEQILTLVEILLRRQGYRVIKAPSAYSALEVLETSVPDLCLLDFMMPGMNGIELCEQIRQHPEAQNVPVLMLSALDGEEFVRDSLRAGANGHIPKSEMHRKLVSAVNQHVSAAQA